MAFTFMHLFAAPADTEPPEPPEPPAPAADAPAGGSGVDVTSSDFKPRLDREATERAQHASEAAQHASEAATRSTDAEREQAERREAREAPSGEAPPTPEPGEAPAGLGHPPPAGAPPAGMEWTESGGGGYVPIGTRVVRTYAAERSAAAHTMATKPIRRKAAV